MHLTVIHPFEQFKRGDKITDAEKIKEFTEGKAVEGSQDREPHPNVRHVVRTAGSFEHPAQ